MTRPRQVEWIPSRVHGTAGFRLMVVLAAPGCAYARATGGCTNCGFAQNLGLGTPVSAPEYLAQLDDALGAIPASIHDPVEVDLYCSGSFFNPEEVPEPAQVQMLEWAAARPEVSALCVESRPEYATTLRLRQAVRACRGKPLEIGIGLESANDEILTQRIRKGFTWNHLVAAAQRVAEAHARLLVYVLLKPIDTGEREAIEDSVATAWRVFALGSELGIPVRVALEPCFVAPKTRLHQAWEAGNYRPPWLWSVVEVVGRIGPLGPVQVGLSSEGMHPHQVAHNCEACSREVRAALAVFNRTQELAGLHSLACDCRAVWKNLAGPAGCRTHPSSQ